MTMWKKATSKKVMKKKVSPAGYGSVKAPKAKRPNTIETYVLFPDKKQGLLGDYERGYWKIGARCPINSGNTNELYRVSQIKKSTKDGQPVQILTLIENMVEDMCYLECTRGDSNKFWFGKVKDNKLISNFGRIGTKGQSAENEYADYDEAMAKLTWKIRDKTRKGYVRAQHPNIRILETKEVDFSKEGLAGDWDLF